MNKTKLEQTQESLQISLDILQLREELASFNERWQETRHQFTPRERGEKKPTYHTLFIPYEFLLLFVVSFMVVSILFEDAPFTIKVIFLIAWSVLTILVISFRLRFNKRRLEFLQAKLHHKNHRHQLNLKLGTLQSALKRKQKLLHTPSQDSPLQEKQS